jgi:hypothetical protein
MPLFILLVIWGALGGILSSASGGIFFRGFLIFTLPPLAIGLAAGFFFVGIDVIAKKFGKDWSSDDTTLISTGLVFLFLIVPLVVYSLGLLLELL